MPELGPIPGAARSIVRDLALVALAALLTIGHRLGDEPAFADESAYFTQAYFADLLLRGAFDDPAWLDYPAYDLPPLPKYAIGLALRLAGRPLPNPRQAMAWYEDINRRFDRGDDLLVARWPTVLFGAIGCASLYGLGLQARDRRTGLLAALLLLINPLYRVHARRAMSDVPTEAMVLASLALGLWAWRRFLAGRLGPGSWLLALLAGSLGGLAALAKLNGAVAMMTVVAWAMLAAALPRVPAVRKSAVAASAVASGLVALATFVLLNPFLTAGPRGPLPIKRAMVAERSLAGRMRWLVEHRWSVSRRQQRLFSSYALRTSGEKVAAVAVQGFGRFGPFGPGRDDSTRRFDWRQDAGALLWWPIVLAGIAWAIGRGAGQVARGEPPTAWAIVVQAALAAVVVTAYLPLAWDRYYLSLQAGSALLAAGAAVSAFDRSARAVRADRGRA